MSAQSAGKGFRRRHYGLAGIVGFIAALLAGCGGDGDSVGGTDGTGNPPAIAGVVLVTPEQVASALPEGFIARLASLFSSAARAQAVGLVPLTEAQIRLFRVGESGEAIEPALQSTTTDADGSYAFENLPAQGLLMVQASARTAILRAYVGTDRVDVTPASELGVRRVTRTIDASARLADLSRPELAALTAYLEALPLPAGRGFDATLESLDAAAGPLFIELLVSYSDEGAEIAPRAGSHGAVEFGSMLRDPALLAAEGMVGGVDTGSGVGVLTFGEGGGPAFIARELFVQEPDGAVRANPGDDLASGADLRGLLHVPAANGQLLVVGVDGAGAVPGAVLADDGLMIYPLNVAHERGGALAAFGAGLRMVMRWPESAPSIIANTRLDALGGEPSGYHLVSMSQSFKGSDSPVMTVAAGSGVLVFDSSPQSRVFPGDSEARDFGGFTAGAGRSPLTLALDDYAVSESDLGSMLPSTGLYRIVAGTGLLELRAEDGARIGAGVLSADGEIVAVETSSSSETAGAMERGFGIAIRRADDAVPALDGAYNLLEYTIRIVADGEDPPRTALVAGVQRHGIVHLDGEGGIVGEATLFDREARLDLGAARAGSDAAIARTAAAETLAMPGTFRVDGSGAVSLELPLQRDGDDRVETLSAAGAADRSGNFIALAVRSAGRDPGRGLLFLVRQPGS